MYLPFHLEALESRGGFGHPLFHNDLSLSDN